jgi:hypothetical protein
MEFCREWQSFNHPFLSNYEKTHYTQIAIVILVKVAPAQVTLADSLAATVLGDLTVRWRVGDLGDAVLTR